MKHKKKLQRVISSLLAVSTMASMAVPLSSSAALTGYGRSAFSAEKLKNYSMYLAGSSKDYGLANSLALFETVGELNDVWSYKSLNVPDSTNGTIEGSGFEVNANGETADDRVKNAYQNGYNFYISLDATDDNLMYTVSRSGKDYVFDSSNNWGWGNTSTGTGGIFYIPSSETDENGGHYTFNAWEANGSYSGVKYATVKDDTGSTQKILTYDDFFSMTSPLVKRDSFTSKANYIMFEDVNLGLKYRSRDIFNDNNNTKYGLSAVAENDTDVGNQALSMLYDFFVTKVDTFATSLDTVLQSTGISTSDRNSIVSIFKKVSQSTLTNRETFLNNVSSCLDDMSNVYSDAEEKLNEIFVEHYIQAQGLPVSKILESAQAGNKHSGWGIALTESDKGTLSCTYRQIGSNQGTPIDVKITVADFQASNNWDYMAIRDGTSSSWTYRNSSRMASKGKTAGYDGKPINNSNEYGNNPLISFSSVGVGIDMMYCDWVKLDYSFYNSETGEEITDIKGQTTFRDIDFGQSVSLLPATENNGNGFTGVYDYDGRIRFYAQVTDADGNRLIPRNYAGYDPLLYKSWEYTNLDGSKQTYWSATDWASLSCQDAYKSNWMYAEFSGPFSLIYGNCSHMTFQDSTVGTTATNNYDPVRNADNLFFEVNNAGTLSGHVTGERVATSAGTGTSSNTNLSTYTERFEIPSYLIRNAQGTAHLINYISATTTELPGKINIIKYVVNTDGTKNIANSSFNSGKWQDQANVYYTIKDENGMYLNYDRSESDISLGTYKIDNDSRTTSVKSTAKFTLGKNGSINLTNLYEANYTIEEIYTSLEFKTSYGAATIKYTSDGSEVTAENGVVPATSDGTSVAIYDPTRTPGSFTFTKYYGTNEESKKVLDSTNNKAANETVKFALAKKADGDLNLIDQWVQLTVDTNGNYIFDSFGTPTSLTAMIVRTEMSLSADGKINVTNLPEGEYILKEITGYADFIGLMDDIEFTVSEGKEISITGMNYLPSGNLEFTKIVRDEDGNEYNLNIGYSATENKALTFKIVDTTNGYFVDVTKKADGSYAYTGISRVGSEIKLGADGKFKITGLPPKKYAIIEMESHEDFEGKMETVNATVTADNTANVSGVNILKSQVGSIIITKNLTKAYYTDEEFIYQVTETDKSGNEMTYFAFISIPAGETSGSVQIDGVTSSYTYTVKELSNNWRYAPVAAQTYLTINDEQFGAADSSLQQYSRYVMNTDENSMTFRIKNPQDNKYNCVFTNNGHDYWLDDGSAVTNVMKAIQ